ncbi:MAG: hypothetical protein K0R17_1743 [Rariglobus sp.]|jgi:hypothetical protein|nr:hypothetical protein [Rariglobus sp.]
MSLSSLKRFLPVAPPRQVVLLSDALFFVRSVPVTEGATAGEVAAQAELAVEALAPFPIAQLYYGHHWLPGSVHALVYAAYRKRFTSDEVELWVDAEAVLPSFVTVLNKADAPKPASVLIVPGAAGFTGLYFSDASGVPTQVRVEPLAAEATDDERTAARAALLAAFPEKYYIVEAGAEPQFDPASPQGEFVFRAGELETHFEASDIAPLDVRDKGELAARRRAHARDVILWRTFLGGIAAIGLAALLEVALVGTSIWQKQRLALEVRQKPVVESIMTSQTLATRIEELSTKRLLPFEMLALVNTVRPPAIQFIRTVTNGLHTLEVEAQTQSSGDIDVFRSALNRLEGCEKAEVLDPRSRDGLSTFRLVVTFKPEALAAPVEESPPSSPPPAAPAPVPAEPQPAQPKPEAQT